jgi:Ulp1 family protease
MKQVNDLKGKKEYIMIEKSSAMDPAVTCYPDSILRLRPDEWFNDELIDAVPGLVEAPDGSQTHILSSYLYDYLEKGDFTQADKCVKYFSKDGTRWAFGISRSLHWVVVLIDWGSHSVLYYNPWEEENPNPPRRTRTLQVSSMSNKHCFSTLTMSGSVCREMGQSPLRCIQ